MAERYPYVQQNRTVAAGTGHDAQEWRWLNAGAVGAGVCGAGHLKVGTGTGMQVTVAAGGAFVPDGAPPFSGLYHVFNDGTVAVNVAVSSQTLGRIDLVVAEVLDTAFGAAEDRWRVRVVAGTSAASPTPPALPARCLLLAQISIPATTVNVNAGNITDRRIPAGAWAASQGLITSATRASASLATNTTYQLWNAIPLTVVVGRYYAFKFAGYVSFSTADGGGEVQLQKDGALFARVLVAKPGVAGAGVATFCITPAFQATAASITYGGLMAKTVGTGNMTLDANFGTPTLEVVDLGGGLT